jgi:ACS family glucarate transporter-like MFS transporter
MMTSGKYQKRRNYVLFCFAVSLAAILYMDRVCISQSQHLISDELQLSKKQMGLVLTIFGVAYGLFEIPGGWLADRFGPRRVLTSGVTWWSLFTMATGWAHSLISLVGYRFLFGMGQACCFPNLTRAFSNWLRGPDRTRAQGLMWLAARWGGAFTPLLVVFVLDFVSWRQSFYLLGSIGFIWAVIFWRWFRDYPQEQPNVNEARQESPVKSFVIMRGHSQIRVPWKRLLQCRSVWLLCLQYACLSYGFWFYLTWLPTYIREQFGLQQTDRYLAALLAAPPLFLAGISCVLTGWLTPHLVRRFGDVRRVRRALGVIGHGMACLMLIISISLENPFAAMIAMGFSCFGNDIAMPGSWAGCMDMGGQFAGTLSGMMNMCGCIGGLLAPWTIPYILDAADGQWRVVILVIAGWYAVGTFCWFGIDPVTPVAGFEERR